MTFVSYAQNFEDVLLWRALGQVDTGFYIDIGAAHPDTDSVTRAFYDRGWHGINVEPVAASFARIAAARPRDVNLHAAVGSAPGSAVLYAIEGMDAGLSTLDAASAARYGGMGLPAQQAEVPMQTLAAICRAHAPADIHFLKIDVEGAERAVLEGADFAAFRPWIVLVEATAPMSTKEVHGEWDGILLGAAYRFVWFDGLNRFYVAEERHAQLAPCFRTPPNVFDDFLRAADTEWTRRINQAETRFATVLPQALAAERRAAIAEDRAEAAFLRLARSDAAGARSAAAAGHRQREAELHQRQAEIRRQEAEDLRRENERLGATLAEAIRHAQQLHQRAERAEQAGALAHEWLDAVRHSTSWRLTGPLRRLGRLRGQAEAEPPAWQDTPATEQAAPAPEPPAAAAEPPPPLVLPPLTRLRAVHQFHSGSAAGDAITNAMLLTQAVLRRLGYDSRIFVEHRDASCSDEINHIGELPQHGHYALIVRHSMGHDALSHILALRAPKILLYHNITPPELLAGSPFLQRYSRRGRDQLAELRPAVAASLADSEYNALELRQAGFDPVATCTLLFDIDSMLACAPPRRPGPVFTILFVGRIARSKGQLELVEAYARFRASYAGESRLALVGRHGDFADQYVAELFARIRHHGLDHGEVEVAGAVSDADLHRHYAEADLYVSLSQHEGFGVPLVEAMAHGVPVLAWPAAAVPYTLGGAALLLDDTTPAGVAARMLDLAHDPAAREAAATRQARSLHRFRLEHQVPKLVAALGRAGVVPPLDEAARDALAANMYFTVAGHVNGSYSLAEVNRSLAAALEAERPGMARLLAVEGDVTTAVSGIPASQRDAVRMLLSRTPETRPHVVVSQHYPVWVPPEPGDLALALFFWEESLVPPETVAVLNGNFAGVLAPTRAVAKALIESGVERPVHVLGQAPRLDPFQRLRAERAALVRDAGAPFTFLHVSSCFPRKGVDVLLDAFAAVFRRSDPVRLVIKGFPNPHNQVAAQIARIQHHPEAPAIELIDTDLDEAGLLALYRGADAMVLPTRGEGYNLPAAEALAAGIPLIVTGYGGHMDLVSSAPPGAVRLLDYRLAPARSHLSSPLSLWAEPDGLDLRTALREAADRGPWIVPEYVVARPGLAPALSRFAAGLILAPPERPVLDVGWVTTWDVPCGVAGYAQHLVGAMPPGGTVFSDRRVEAMAAGPDRTAVIPSWTVGDLGSLPGLGGAIVRQDPRAVVVQHQPGLMQWSMLACFLRLPALYGRVVCVTLHNTRHLLDIEAAERDAALGALALASRIVVHTPADADRLARLGLADTVTVIPQGAPASRRPGAPDPRALTPDQDVLIGCYGFFLPGKGIPELVQAMAILRRRWPRARLRLVNAEYPHPLSADEIERTRDLARHAGLADAVEFVTGFLEHDVSTDLLMDCDLIVLPYQASQEASSAALRSALTAGVAVAVTPLPLFGEATDAVITLPGRSPADLAAGIDAALSDPAGRSVSVAAARLWLDSHGWGSIAARWDRMLRGLSGSGIVMGRSDEPG